jgi:gluconolactonase
MRTLALAAAAALAVVTAAATSYAQPYPTVGALEPLDPAFSQLVAPNARLEKLAEGFDWSEGPVWRKRTGDLLFSDVPGNTIFRWKDGEGVSIFLRPAGYAGPSPVGREHGTNGLTLDAQGRLIIADHGWRQVSRLDETRWLKTAVADRYQGKRFNSPNDVVVRSNGDVYFTDPPYGLDGLNDSPAKEQPHNGVYRVTPNGEVTLLTTELPFPNGLAFSPDERTLYVANSDPARAVWMAFDLRADGTLGPGRVLFDATPLARAGKRGAPDGFKVDRAGNLWATGPGGVLVITPQGKHLGTIATGQATANCAWGDDGSTLYITADSQLLRIRTNARGAGF